ncbi:hypothetical protein [Nodularia sp. NIES-3585]|uniref:hypothetical protein n=1 Tax=Nodularia sp. NIES-3585 TaxID=1973477 RepID=UPI000B5CF3EB|nr:hypothetical protein [Nodularia sp. NIES-3585]GAX37890.1 hypothetical protein NIES3585_39350 [Nodularia sp. NIES-3585]
MTYSLANRTQYPDDGRVIILPGDPAFDWTLAFPPPDWKQTAAKDPDGFAFVVEPGSGIARVATASDLEEYLYGGEYDERLDEIGETEEDCEWDG